MGPCNNLLSHSSNCALAIRLGVIMTHVITKVEAMLVAGPGLLFI